MNAFLILASPLSVAIFVWMMFSQFEDSPKYRLIKIISTPLSFFLYLILVVNVYDLYWDVGLVVGALIIFGPFLLLLLLIVLSYIFSAKA